MSAPKRFEGPYKHVITFIFSLILTLIAFAMVRAAGVNKAFTYLILVVMAILQVIVQLGFWMHMKDKGHLMPILFLAGALVVILPVVLTGLLLIWW